MIQLEYWLDGNWRVVVRYDYDRHAPGGHDITDEGLHLDVYRDGAKVRTERVTGPIPATDGFDGAEADFRENAKRYVRRFERWHDISGRNDRGQTMNSSSFRTGSRPISIESGRRSEPHSIPNRTRPTGRESGCDIGALLWLCQPPGRCWTDRLFRSIHEKLPPRRFGRGPQRPTRRERLLPVLDDRIDRVDASSWLETGYPGSTREVIPATTQMMV